MPDRPDAPSKAIVPTWADRLQRLRHMSARLMSRFTPQTRRRIWRVLTALSLVLLLVSSYVVWDELDTSDLHVAPQFLLLALTIYIFNYGLYTFGWHFLAQRFCDESSFRVNAQAVAASNLVKHLPTPAWYIANRADFYARRGVPVQSVVAASLLELLLIGGSGSLLLLIFWFNTYTPLLSLLTILFLGLLLFALAAPHTVLRHWWRAHISTHAINAGGQGLLIGALMAYGTAWLTGVAFFWSVLHTFAPVPLSDIVPLTLIWLLTGVASLVVSVSVGTSGFAREVTLTLLLAPIWSLPVALVVAVVVKLLLTLGEVVVSGIVLSLLRIARRR